MPRIVGKARLRYRVDTIHHLTDMALLEFYGKECPHCVRMMPLVERLEKELGVEVKKMETWHDAANDKERAKHDAGNACGGVPFFVNEETGSKICGGVDYEALKAWATGK